MTSSPTLIHTPPIRSGRRSLTGGHRPNFALSVPASSLGLLVVERKGGFDCGFHHTLFTRFQEFKLSGNFR